MAKFRYKVFDPQTESQRTGALEAPDPEAAQTYLLRKGCTILWMRSFEDAPAMVVQDARRESLPIGRKPNRYRSTPLDYWRKLRLSDQSFGRVLSLGAVVGVLLLFFGGQDRSVSAQASTASATTFSITIKGQLVSTSGSPLNPESLKLTLQLPQVPFGKSWKGREAIDEQGEINHVVEFQTARPTGFAKVQVERAGYRSLVLPGRTLTFNAGKASLDLGRQRMDANH